MIRRCSQMLKLADSMTRVLASKSANTFLIETIRMSTLDLYWSNMSCQNRTLYQKELRKSRKSFTMFIYKRGCVTFRESRRKKIDRVPKSAGKIQNFQVLIVIIIITYRDCALVSLWMGDRRSLNHLFRCFAVLRVLLELKYQYFHGLCNRGQ